MLTLEYYEVQRLKTLINEVSMFANVPTEVEQTALEIRLKEIDNILDQRDNKNREHG